jgi:hypothetical protein
MAVDEEALKRLYTLLYVKDPQFRALADANVRSWIQKNRAASSSHSEAVDRKSRSRFTPILSSNAIRLGRIGPERLAPTLTAARVSRWLSPSCRQRRGMQQDSTELPVHCSFSSRIACYFIPNVGVSSFARPTKRHLLSAASCLAAVVNS